MKYIRTKDGRLVKHPHPNAEVFTFRYEILKIADTIEELCDEFVVLYEDGARIVYGDLEWAKVKSKASLEFGNKPTICGAIWTDKGLQFVARINSEGVLELL